VKALGEFAALFHHVAHLMKGG